MKYIYFLITIFLLNACSGQQIVDNITKAQISISGNKSPASFRIENVYTMDNYIFNMENYTISLPSAIEEDFSVFNGWEGLTHYNRDITLYLGTEELGYPYHIVISTSGNVLEYSARARAIENKDQAYIKYVRKEYKYSTDEKLYFSTQGKENYSCITTESREKKYGKKDIAYNCYKFNPKRTKTKSVTIVLTYNKVPTLPENYKNLAQEYTYEDLQKRAKRVLDSLYIKADWDE